MFLRASTWSHASLKVNQSFCKQEDTRNRAAVVADQTASPVSYYSGAFFCARPRNDGRRAMDILQEVRDLVRFCSR